MMLAAFVLILKLTKRDGDINDFLPELVNKYEEYGATA